MSATNSASSPRRPRETDPHLEIWNRNRTTDALVDGLGSAPTTKAITGKDYSGTSIAPLYIVMRLTQEFGPCGEGWGIEVEDEQYVEGETYYNADGNVIGKEKLHTLRARMWWRPRGGGEKRSYACYGATKACYMAGKSKGGGYIKMDEDAAKKSLTDALTKAATYLGVGADVHLGQWDDSKYREERTRDETRNAMAKPLAFVSAAGDIFYAKDIADWKSGWVKRIGGLVSGGKLDLLTKSRADNATAFSATREVHPEAVAEIEAALKAAFEPEATKPALNGAAASPPAADPTPAATPAPATNGVTLPPVPEGRPDVLKLADKTGKEYLYASDIRTGRTLDELWFSGFCEAIRRITGPDDLNKFIERNKDYVADVKKHFPERAAEARVAFDARRAMIAPSQPQAAK